FYKVQIRLRLQTVGFNYRYPAEAFLGKGIQLRKVLLDDGTFSVYGDTQLVDGIGKERQRSNGIEREFRSLDEHIRDHYDEQDPGLYTIHDCRTYIHPNPTHIFAYAVHEVPGPVLLVEVKREVLIFSVDLILQVVFYVPGNHNKGLPHDKGKDGSNKGGAQEEQDVGDQFRFQC